MNDDKIFESYSLTKGRYHVILNDIDTKIQFANYPILVGFNELEDDPIAIQYYITYDSRMAPFNKYFMDDDPQYSLDAIYYNVQKYILLKYTKAIKNMKYYEYKRFKGRFPLILAPTFLDASFISDDMVSTILNIVEKFALNNIAVPNIMIYNADSLKDTDITSYVLSHYMTNITLFNHDDICAPTVISQRLVNDVSAYLNKLFTPACFQTMNCGCNDRMSSYYQTSLFSEMGRNGMVMDKDI